MMKRIISVISACLIIFSAILSAAPVYAINPIDVDRACSLKIEYGYSGELFEGLEISTYKIADVCEDGTYNMTKEFADYSVNIYGITSQAEWKKVSTTLASYISADSIKPTYTSTTDENGCAKFDNIEAGMYLTLEKKVTSGETVITFENFLTAVPSPKDEEDHLYDVFARPKYSAYTPTKKELDYKIVKQWKDEGNAANRPENVEIDILKNGSIHSSIILNSSNNWSYSWKCEDDGSKWEAVERNILGEYVVSVEYDKTTIIVTNTCFNAPENPPQTGDINTTEPYVLTMSISGILLMIMALLIKRREQ
ncbi:MAG: Cna B-type domain-containing protein [Clostridia bacterium]|nr:Cna B-type domain-containing protein [Clostridia bacterium]